MLDETATYTFKGQVFQSKEAMELYIASRHGIKPMGYRPGSSHAMRHVLLTAGALFLIHSIHQSITDKPRPQELVSGNRVGQPSENRKKVLATLIRLQEERCAMGAHVSRIRNNAYSVECTRFLDGTGAESCALNAASGAV